MVPSSGLGTLARLPHELLHNIVFLLVAQKPLGPPSELIPLLLTSKHLNLIASENSLRARIFKLKFDDGAVRRRSFDPYTRDLAEQLVHACWLLRALRIGDVYSIDAGSDLCTAYMMMLDNDGKNFAQLEWAGLDKYVDAFVRQRLWEGSEFNEGWPLSSRENACALWLMWLTLTNQKLLTETFQLREDLVLLIFPFVVLPQRYAVAEAPPNHFHLPLSNSNPLHQPPLTLPIPSSSPQPATYPHYTRLERTESQVHFGARPAFSAPLITTAAKLLFVARREIYPIRVPHILPVGLTAADYHELNRSKVAALPRGARWDWNAGVRRAVNLDVGERDIPIEVEESKKWDTEWWRRRLCYDLMAPRPKFAPGLTYTPGSMHGAWQGRIYIPQGNLFNQLFHSPIYPGVADENGNLSEKSLGLIMQPVFFNIQEHHRICGCPSSKHLSSCFSSPSTSDAASASTEPSATTLVESSGCGIIPVPPPEPVVVTRAADADDEQDFGEDFDAAPPSHPFTAGEDASINGYSVFIDFSMGNAWFPGALGGISYRQREAYATDSWGRKRQKRDEVVIAVNYERPDLFASGKCGTRTSETEVVAGGSGASSGSPPQMHSATNLPPNIQRQTGPPSSELPKSYVYETYDPTRPSSHDPSSCVRCAEWDAARKRERRRARKEVENNHQVVLESYMRDFARRNGRAADTQEEEGGMENLDVSGFGFDDASDVAQKSPVDDSSDTDMRSGSAPSSSDAGSSDGEDEDEEDSWRQVDILGDDRPGGEPALYDENGKVFAEATRRVFDRERVGVAGGCCGGVRDIVLTGETDPRHAVWHQQQYKMYGRVRPWDGLIGILRVGHVPSVNFLFVCGYLVGENNFVGEWRVAGADPLRPAWGSAFVMSRRK